MWCTAERRLVRHDSTCLFQESIPAISLGNAKHPLPTRSLRSLRGTVCSTNSALCPHHAHPFVAAERRKITVACRKAKGLVTELWSPRFVTMLWLCSRLCYETAANQWTIVEIELLAKVGWKWGCQYFSCPCSQNVTHCRKEICSTCLFKESIPAIPFGISKHPLCTRSRFLRAAAHSTSSAILWLHHAHPFVATPEKNLSHAREGEGLVTECGRQHLLQYSDCDLSCAIWLLQTNEQLSRLSFWQKWVGSETASLSAAHVL